MKDFAVYNENDEFAAEGLRELIKSRIITPGIVDERSICDVNASDYSEFTRVHLFAGAGAWDIALNHRRWPAGRRVGTGSCPCPPFSAAGKKQRCPGCGGRPVPCPVRTGYFVCTACCHAWFADGRHLWPEMFRFVTELGIPDWFGEQVASADGRIWYAGVRASLEPFGCAVGCADLCAPGVGEECELGIVRGDSFAVERGRLGPPHIRQRLFWHARWLADGSDGQCQGRRAGAECGGQSELADGFRMEHVQQQQGLEGHAGDGGDGDEPGRVDPLPGGPVAEAGGVGGFPDLPSDRLQGGRESGGKDERRKAENHRGQRSTDNGDAGRVSDPHGRKCNRESDGQRCQCYRQEAGRQQGDGEPECSCPNSRGLADGKCKRANRETAGQKRPANQGSGNLGELPPSVGPCGGESGYTGEWLADGDGRDSGPQREQYGREHGLFTEDSGTGFWSDFDFVPCLDGKARRVKSGLRCLADGCARGVLPSDDPGASYAETVGEARQARIRWYGNMIVWQLASEFIASCEEVER